jgi:hypothetical protein
MKAALVALICASVIGGCSRGPGWEDATGRGRGEKELRADALFCTNQNFAALERLVLERGTQSDAEIHALTAQAWDCMRSHGWRPPNSN